MKLPVLPLAGAALLVLALVTWIFDPPGFARGWLAMATIAIGLPLGAMALIFAHALAGGAWGEAVGRELRRIAVALPFLLPLLIPVLIGLHLLYPWTNPGPAGTLDKAWWLNPAFFVIRTLIYAAIWFVLALWAQEPAIPRPRAAVAMILLVLTVTFSAIDWILSRDPHWFSTDFGMVVLARDALDALALALVLRLGATRGVPDLTLSDLAKLLLGGVILWTYLDFMQFLIVWESDLPREAGWYVARLQEFWVSVAGLLVALSFLLPFFALLSGRVRRDPNRIRQIAGLLLLLRLPYHWWLVNPSDPTGAVIGLPDLLAVVGLVALGAWFLREERSFPTLPRLRLGHG